MKSGRKGWGEKVVLMFLIIFLAGCGGSSSSANLTESEGGGGGGGTGISNSFDSPAEMGVGDLMPIEFGDATSVSVDFSGVEEGANFILAIGSSSTSISSSVMRLTSSLSAPENNALIKGMEISGDIENDGEYGSQEIFDAWLRASEDTLPDGEIPANASLSSGHYKAMAIKAAGLGGTETFRVLSSLSSTTSYVEVTGKVRCVGSNVLFYVDTTVGSDLLSDADVESLCREFDGVAGAEQDLLGATSDVDDDGKLHILMTKQINRLGALGGGIITGYFYAGDLYAQSQSNPVSNYREVIYTLVPDPFGQYGTAISNDFAMSNLLPAVLPHELQHAISYNQHVFVSGGMPEENWLNEGISHLVEDVMGYGVENPARYSMYLSSPSTYGVVTQSSPNLIERGESYLFLRFLHEQAANGSAFLRALENTSARGVDNLIAAFSGPENMNELSEMMARWSVALAMTDRGLSQDSRYIFRARVKNASTGNWEGACLSCEADDNRGTVLSGVNLNTYYGNHSPTIDSTAVMFFNITTLPNTLTLAGTQGGGNFGVLIRSK